MRPVNASIETRILILCLFLAVGLSLIYSRRDLPLGHDEGYYLQMANGTAPDLKGVWPPLFPAIGSVVLKLGFSGLEVISLVSLCLLLILLSRILIESGKSQLGVVLVTLCPAVFAYGWAAMSELLFALLITLAIWLFVKTEKWWQGLLSGILVVLSYQTRYLGQFLVGWMLLMILFKRNRWQVMTFVVGLVGVAASMIINVLRYRMVAGERTPSHYGLLDNLYYLGLTPWTVWIGEGPLLRHPSVPLSIAGVVVIAWALIVKERAYSLAIACYLGLLIVVEMIIAVDPINRRYILPVLPLAIALNADKLKRYQWIVIGLAGLASLAHALRGATV